MAIMLAEVAEVAGLTLKLEFLVVLVV